MRKLETQASKNKKKKQKGIIVGVIMIAILVFSTAGFALFSQDSDSEKSAQKVTFNGFSFQKQDNYWITTISQQNHIFFYLPTELNNISINITNDLLTYVNKPLYIVNENAARNQIDFNLLTTNYVLRTPNACTNEENCTGDFPIKNCATDNVIIYKESNITKIYQEDNCIYITGEPVKGTDKFLQKILGIN